MDIDDIQKLLPESVFKSKKEVYVLLHKIAYACCLFFLLAMDHCLVLTNVCGVPPSSSPTAATFAHGPQHAIGAVVKTLMGDVDKQWSFLCS